MRCNRRACRNKRRHRRPMCHGNHLKRRSRRNFRRHSSRKVARVALFSSTTAHKAATTARKAPAATLIADDGNPESDSDDAYFASDGAESADALAFSASGNAKTASEQLFGVLARRSAGAVRMSAFGQERTFPACLNPNREAASAWGDGSRPTLLRPVHSWRPAGAARRTTSTAVRRRGSLPAPVP